MNYLLLFLLFSQFLLLSLITFTNGSQFMVEIEPDWKPLPEYRSLLEPEQFREVFQSNRFEVQIYKEGIQEGISIAGSRFMMLKERDVFLFENIPGDWMEPNRVVVEIKLPPILIVKKLLLSEESFYQPRIHRKFRILRNQNTPMMYRNKNTLMIYKFSILENPKRNFRTEDLLPPMETPKGGNEVAYMESLNNSLTKLEQSEQLCAQTKYECNLNLLLKYTHVERQFDTFLREVSKRTLTVSTQNYDTIATKSDKLFTDIIKLAMVLIEEEKKLFKENASSSIDLHYPTPAVPILQLHSQHHALNRPQSSQATPTSGTMSSAELPLNRKISFKLMTLERIAQVLSGLQPSRISQPSQINIPVGTNQERMKFIMSDYLSPNSLNSGQFANVQAGHQQQHHHQKEIGQKSHKPAGQTKEKGKRIKHYTQYAAPYSSYDDHQDVLLTVIPNVVRQKEEEEERSKLANSIGLTLRQIYLWINNTNTRLITQEKTRQEFKEEKKKYQFEMAATGGDNASASASKVPPAAANEKSNAEEVSSSEEIDQSNTKTRLNEGVKVTRWEFENWKKKYQSEMAATAGGDKDKASASASAPAELPPADANRIKHPNQYAAYDDHQWAALWRHLVRFEDVWVTDRAKLEKRIEEQSERFNLPDLLGLEKDKVYKWLYNTKTRMKTSEKLRREFEYWKKKYQSEMAATGVDKEFASASKIPTAAANEKASNVEVIFSSEETDPNPLAIVPYEPIPNDPIDARPINWMPPASDSQNKIGQKRKHPSEFVPVAGDQKRFKLLGYVFNDHQRSALWRHFVKFEDVLFKKSADVYRQKEEDEERTKLSNSIGLTLMQIYQWINNINRKLSRDSLIIREQFESEKKKYQSEMATKIAEDKASASANAPKISPTAVNSEMTAKISIGKDKASGSASAPAEVSPSGKSANLNLEQSNADEEDKMQEDNE